MAVQDDRKQADITFTRHGLRRFHARGVRLAGVCAALDWGEVVHSHGAERFVVTRRAVRLAARQGVDITAHEGVHVVLAQGAVVTVYRNRDGAGSSLRTRRPRRGKRLA